MRFSQIGHRVITEANFLATLGSISQQGLRILMYHSVGGRAVDDPLGYNSISKEAFIRQMDIITEDVNISTTPINLAECQSKDLNVAISFDDGYRDNLTVAAPILLDRNIPFTVYVATQFVRDRQTKFMSPEELRELSSLPGVTIGAHGNTHIPLTSCDEKMLANELSSSKAYLEDLIGREVKTMSYPHGSVNSKVHTAVEVAGYKLAACSNVGINQIGCPSLLLARTVILSQDDDRFFGRKLHGYWDWYRLLQKNNQKRP